MEHSLLDYILFSVFVVGALIVDLKAHDEDKPVSVKNAAIWTSIWISLAFCFAGYVAYASNLELTQLFVAGYLLELSLSVDNLFVIMAILTSFGIKDAYQHRVIFYGILGAILMRMIFIAAGAGLIKIFGPYALGVFGIFILWTALKMYQSMRNESHKEDIDYSTHWAIKWTKKFIPIFPNLYGHNFLVRTDETGTPVEPPKGSIKENIKIAENPVGKIGLRATPLFMCIVVIMFTDIMFAFDSIPAILAITDDIFIVYTSNIFAVLGLRSMFFLLAAAKRYLKHLEKSVIAILVFVGIKMLIALPPLHLHVPATISLCVVLGLLSAGILASFIPSKGNEAE